MIEICTCCYNGCSSKSEKHGAQKYGFPKKLLVATSVLWIIAMVLMPSEARSVEHKIRHERRQHDASTPTKLRMSSEAHGVEHRRRPHRKQIVQTHVQDSGIIKTHRSLVADLFKNATKKIIKKLTNTKRFFKEEKKVLNETKEYRDGMPSWLPSINFVDIHFYNYRNQRRPGATISERKFVYLMPKLYKSLVEFQHIFKLLKIVEVDIVDDPFNNYNKTREDLIEKTLQRLYSTIAEIKENMIAVNISVPHVNQSQTLQVLKNKIDAPQCLKNDYIAFRAYGNLLNNWYLEFRCPRGKKVITKNKKCETYENKLKEKKERRHKNHER